MDLTTTDYLWLTGGAIVAILVGVLRHKIFMHRLKKVSGVDDGRVDALNAQMASMHDKYDVIWADCDFGVLTEDSPAFNIINVRSLPHDERYKVYFTVQPNNGETIDELFEGEMDADSAISLTLGDAKGAYYSEDGYTAGVWSDERLIWGISIRDLQRSAEDVSNKRNYPPQADLRRVWEQVARNVKLRSSEQSLKAVQDNFDESKTRLRKDAAEGRE